MEHQTSNKLSFQFTLRIYTCQFGDIIPCIEFAKGVEIKIAPMIGFLWLSIFKLSNSGALIGKQHPLVASQTAVEVVL